MKPMATLKVPEGLEEHFEAYEDHGVPWDAFLVLTVAERTRLHDIFQATEEERLALEEAVAADERKLDVRRADWNDVIKKAIPPAPVRSVLDSDEDEVGIGTSANPISSAHDSRGTGGENTEPVTGVVVDKALARNFGSLRNQASTCYLNALLQALFHIPYFRQVIYQMEIPAGTQPGESIPLALQRLFCLLQTKQRSVSTVELTSAFGWSTADAAVQHDIHELARKLMDVLDDQMNGTAQEHKVKKLFQGVQVFYTRCLDEDYTSKREQVFYDVELVVKGCSSVEQSLDAYTKPERLDGKIYKREHDDGTVTLHEAERGVCFKRLPPVLMLHPNRLDFCMRTFQRVTVENEWSVPLEISMGKYVDADVLGERQESETDWRRNNSISVACNGEGGGEGSGGDDDEAAEAEGEIGKARDADLVYVLHSIVIHSGGASYGHYYCYVRFGTQWIKFNDDTVTVESEATVMDDAFGGETTYRDAWGNLKSYPKVKRASLLTYINKAVLEKIVFEMSDGPDALPAHLQSAIDEAKNRDEAERIRKEREARLVSVTTLVEDTAGEYLGALGDTSLRRTFKFDKEATVDDMKRTLAEELGIPVARQRLWRYHSYFGYSDFYRGDEYCAKPCEEVEGFTASHFSTYVGYVYNSYTILFVQVLPKSGGERASTSPDPDARGEAGENITEVAAPPAATAAAPVEATADVISSSAKHTDPCGLANSAGATGVDHGIRGITEAELNLPRLIHVRVFEAGVLVFRRAVGTLGELHQEFLAGRESGEGAALFYFLKVAKAIKSLTEIVSGDSIVIAPLGTTPTEVNQAHDRVHRAVEVTLCRLSDAFRGEEVMQLTLVSTMKYPEIQLAVFEELSRLKRDESPVVKEIELPPSAAHIGLRKHDWYSDLPSTALSSRSRYQYSPEWRRDSTYDNTLELLLTCGGYSISKLYFEVLPVPLNDIDEERVAEFTVSLGEAQIKHVYIQVADKPSKRDFFARIHSAAGIEAGTHLRLVPYWGEAEYGDWRTTDRPEVLDNMAAFDFKYYKYYVDLLPELEPGRSEAEQELVTLKHVSRQSGEVFFGYPTRVVLVADDTGETFLRRALRKLRVPDKQVASCLRNWRLLIHGGYQRRQLVQLKDRVSDALRAMRDKIAPTSVFFMLDHPMPQSSRAKAAGGERELVIRSPGTGAPAVSNAGNVQGSPNGESARSEPTTT